MGNIIGSVFVGIGIGFILGLFGIGPEVSMLIGVMFGIFILSNNIND